MEENENSYKLKPYSVLLLICCTGISEAEGFCRRHDIPTKELVQVLDGFKLPEIDEFVEYKTMGDIYRRIFSDG